MITLENISTGDVINGEELEYFIDDETQIGEVYVDGDLVFQALDVLNDRQLEHALHLEYKLVEDLEGILSEFNQF
jgi:hypothetical protein|tara:strand:- start:42 stop:266 length:225 start_codon:yes stop_codon:yes gene_type:complete